MFTKIVVWFQPSCLLGATLLNDQTNRKPGHNPLRTRDKSEGKFMVLAILLNVPGGEGRREGTWDHGLLSRELESER